jgi:hypothetical protein
MQCGFGPKNGNQGEKKGSSLQIAVADLWEFAE